MEETNRRDFFRSFAKPFVKEEDKIQILRPPYFENESDFSSCIECEKKDCKIACDNETKIITILEDGTPSINFSSSGCTYCDECANACTADILKVENKKDIDTKIQIDMLKCLGWNDTMCFSCKDPCLDNAIDFAGLFKPEISDKCTSCGYCISYCPTNAIILINKD